MRPIKIGNQNKATYFILHKVTNPLGQFPNTMWWIYLIFGIVKHDDNITEPTAITEWREENQLPTACYRWTGWVLRNNRLN